MKFLAKTIAVFTAIVSIACLGLIFIPEWINDQRLYTFAQCLYNYPLPPDTQVEARYAEVGLLEGNGNHCDFRAKQRLSSTLTREQITTYYRNVGLPPVSIQSISAKIWREDGLLPITMSFDETPQSDGRTRFTIEIFDPGYLPEPFGRCG